MRFGHRQRFEDDMDDELRFHIEAYVADLVRSGISHEEAARRARIEFGSMETKKEECRQAYGLQRLDELGADLRLTFRTIRRNPGFAAVAILSLALGIGATTAIFGVLDAVMLRLLPVRDPSGLVFVYSAGYEGRDGPPYPYFELLRDQAKSFDSVAAFSPSGIELVADRGRELARGVWVTGNFYETLGVRALLGRTLVASDDQPGGDDGGAAVISRAYWQQRFGGDPSVIGRVIQVFNHSVTIVGILPTEIMSLEPGRPIDIAVPMKLSSPEKMRDRTALWLFVVGRLRGGVPAQQARAEADGLFQAYMAGVSVSDQVRRMLFQRIEISDAGQGLSGLRSMYSRPLTVLMILAGLVLCAACANLANMMLGRALARQRDFAVRLAIGASRGRLIRQTLVEALVLVGGGLLFGILFAHVGTAALAAFFSEGNTKIVLDLSFNLRVLSFAAGVTLLSGLALGILPAIRAANADPALGLQGGSRGVAGTRAAMAVSRGLVVVQVALSVVLLAGTGLFVRSLNELKSVDLGYRSEGILTMEVAPERRVFGTPEWFSLQTRILDNVRRVPGVRAAGWATMNPMSGRDRGAMIEAEGFSHRTDEDRKVHLAAVSPEHFETLEMPVLFGRSFTERDSGNAPKVAILNETAARFYFGRSIPIGRKMRFTNYPSPDLIYEIVGVVKDIRHDSLRDPVARFIYLPIPQHVERINRLALAVRCFGDPILFAEPVRKQIASEGSALLITDVNTMEKQVEDALLRERLVAALSATFGTVAMTLSCIGLYGLLAYTVTRRTNEIGIRMALGASRGSVTGLVVSEALRLASAGVVIGLSAAAALGQVTRALLFGVDPYDPQVYAGVTTLLLALAATAAVGPSRRASSLDPVSALRQD